MYKPPLFNQHDLHASNYYSLSLVLPLNRLTRRLLTMYKCIHDNRFLKAFLRKLYQPFLFISAISLSI